MERLVYRQAAATRFHRMIGGAPLDPGDRDPLLDDALSSSGRGIGPALY